MVFKLDICLLSWHVYERLWLELSTKAMYPSTRIYAGWVRSTDLDYCGLHHS